ncbi:MAG TPA: hypothetical protein VMQ83_04000 [Gammaproteobacteria bacterium]|nr:hypothetical protein [Gammaproteobacteria bacterium]
MTGLLFFIGLALLVGFERVPDRWAIRPRTTSTDVVIFEDTAAARKTNSAPRRAEAT